MENIQLLMLFSGKRKCGKDYLSDNLTKRLGSQLSEIIRISEPIKSEWARQLNLDLDLLLSDGPYKEKYRKDMIIWSDQIRAKDCGFFCRKAVERASKSIVIVSDIRRKTDITYFNNTFGARVKTIRIFCPEEVRLARGWTFQKGVDDVKSECDLDDYIGWDLELFNDGSLSSDDIIEKIYNEFNLSAYMTSK